MLSRRPRQSHCFAAVQRGWKRQHHKKHIASLSSSVVLHSQGYTYAYATLQACWRRLSNSTGARPKVCAGRSAISKSLERAMWSSQRPAPLHPFEWAKRFFLWKQASHRSSRHFPSWWYRGFAQCVGFEARSSMKIYDCLSDAGVSSTQAAAPLNKDKCLHGENATPKWQHYRLSNSVYRLVFSSAQNPMLSSTTEQSIDNTTEVFWAGIGSRRHGLTIVWNLESWMWDQERAAGRCMLFKLAELWFEMTWSARVEPWCRSDCQRLHGNQHHRLAPKPSLHVELPGWCPNDLPSHALGDI